MDVQIHITSFWKVKRSKNYRSKCVKVCKNFRSQACNGHGMVSIVKVYYGELEKKNMFVTSTLMPWDSLPLDELEPVPLAR